MKTYLFQRRHRALMSDTRMVGGLLALLQFVGGLYLLLPVAHFLPPFNKLAEAIPTWGFAIYFIASGMAGGISTDLPDGLQYTKIRLYVALWMFFDWCFLSVTTALTLMYLIQHPEKGIIYGIAMAFYPCLTIAAYWKCRRLRGLLRDEIQEEQEQAAHLQELKAASARTQSRLHATKNAATEVLCGR